MGNETFKEKAVNINIMEDEDKKLLFFKVEELQNIAEEQQGEITFLRTWNKSIQARLNEAITERYKAVKQKAKLEEKYSDMRLVAIRLCIFLCVSMIINILLII